MFIIGIHVYTDLCGLSVGLQSTFFFYQINMQLYVGVHKLGRLQRNSSVFGTINKL
jgi:hypothetical protein